MQSRGVSDAEFLFIQEQERKTKQKTKLFRGIRTQVLVMKDKKKCKNPAKDKIMGKLGYKKIKCGVYVKKTPVIRKVMKT